MIEDGYTRADLRPSDLPTLSRIVLMLGVIVVAQRLLSLPRLVAMFDAKHSEKVERAVDIDRICWLTKGVLRRLFSGRYCMKRSLILFHYLRRMGRDVRIYFGVVREGAALAGHAWVTVNGEVFAEDDGVGRYAVTYSYPPQWTPPS